MKNKYYIVKNRDLAITLKVLTRQEPYEYPHKFEEGKSVWSFIRDEVFIEALDTVRYFINK